MVFETASLHAMMIAPVFGEAGVLPSLSCVFALTRTNSTRMSLLEMEVLDPFQLMHRTSILEQRHASPLAAWAKAQAHVAAWNAAALRGCEHTLVVEDDAFFDDAAALRSLPRAQAFLERREQYDVLFLGWGGEPVVRPTEQECVYSMSRAAGLHAYIISAEAAREWREMEWRSAARREPSFAIDAFLMAQYDRGRFYTVRPMLAFQRDHHTNGTLADQARALENVSSRSMESERARYAAVDAVHSADC